MSVSNRSMDGAGQLVMMQIVLIGLGAGAATALLFASVASGSLLSIFLFYVAPLPIMIAALGWSHWAGLIAALAAAAALAGALGSVFFLAFMAGTGLPAWWLGYLALLARPAASAGAPDLEWYPPGRLVLWAAGFAAAVVMIGLLNIGTDLDAVRTGLQQALERVVQFRTDGTDDRTHAALINFLVAVMPPAAAVLATITNVMNLWLAARIVKFSGHLRRPWPDLSAIEFPPLTAAALALTVMLTFAGGLLGLFAAVAAATLLIAYAVLGFAVLHAITRGVKARPLILSAAYASVLLFGWPVLAMCVLGLADVFFGLRKRGARRPGPPATT